MIVVSGNFWNGICTLTEKVVFDKRFSMWEVVEMDQRFWNAAPPPPAGAKRTCALDCGSLPPLLPAEVPPAAGPRLGFFVLNRQWKKT